MVGFEPTPTSTAAPSNTETTVIPSRSLRSLKKELSWPRFLCITRRIGLLGFVVLTQSSIYKDPYIYIYKTLGRRGGLVLELRTPEREDWVQFSLRSPCCALGQDTFTSQK